MIMNQVRTVLKIIGIPLAFTVAIGGINIYYNHDVNYELDGKRHFKKVDGPFHYTEIIINDIKSTIEVKKLGFGYKSYEDENNDKEVDWIFYGGNPLSRGAESEHRSFRRNRDLEKNIQLFQDADKVFEKELKRFNLY